MAMNTGEHRLWRLLDALANDACIDAESVEKDLREAGLDPDEIKERGLRFVQRLQSQMHLSSAKAQRQRRAPGLSALQKQVAERIRASGEQAKDILTRTLSDRPDFAVNFQKIESLDPEDAVEILDEIELLKLLSEMEDGDEE